MKFLDEYRDPKAASAYVEAIARITTRPWKIMEVCGGQTHAILKHGIDRVLPDKITLLHGPGCPVCVTPTDIIDKAISIASSRDVIFCSFGDMLRVPGSVKNLLKVKSEGGDVRIVYSPADTLDIARNNPSKEVVFFAIGFETTAPAVAMTVYQAKRLRLSNFSILSAQMLIPPAIELMLSSPDRTIQGLLAAGHVCTITGSAEYEKIASKFNIPVTITGFEPLDILQGVYLTVSQLEGGRALVENQYSRVVRPEGNTEAIRMMKTVFRAVDRAWRGFGMIPKSGLALADEYVEFDVERRLNVPVIGTSESSECEGGLILQGLKKPSECAAFGHRCTPDHPLGPPMVSSEGACAAYYRYGNPAAVHVHQAGSANHESR